MMRRGTVPSVVKKKSASASASSPSTNTPSSASSSSSPSSSVPHDDSVIPLSVVLERAQEKNPAKIYDLDLHSIRQKHKNANGSVVGGGGGGGGVVMNAGLEQVFFSE